MTDEVLKSWITGDIFSSAPDVGVLSAWEPWDMTRHILFEFQNSEIDEEHPEWRYSWFAGAALLRTIGHVLKKVDATKSLPAQSAIDAHWVSWNQNKDEHWIFFDFIEQERNNILKEFSFGARLPEKEDGRLLAYGNTDFDAAQLFREAVYWWQSQLESIEASIAQ